MTCPYCGAFVPNDDKKCPKCDKRIVTEQEYLWLQSEHQAYQDRVEAFKFRVGLLFNCIFPGLGVYVKTGNITLFLLMLVLYGGGLALTIWTFITGKGTPFIVIEPLARHAVSIWLMIKEEDKK